MTTHFYIQAQDGQFKFCAVDEKSVRVFEGLLGLTVTNPAVVLLKDLPTNLEEALSFYTRCLMGDLSGSVLMSEFSTGTFLHPYFPYETVYLGSKA